MPTSTSIFKTMTAQEFDQWSRLPHAVVRRCFWWAYQSRLTGVGYKCALEYDDLVSEGNLALLDAWNLYDENLVIDGRHASFKTYAYRSIFNRVSRYVDANINKITTRNLNAGKEGKTDQAGKEERVDKARKAGGHSHAKQTIGCMLFSDMNGSTGTNDWPTLVDKHSPAPDAEYIESEWQTSCIDLLKQKLGKRKTNILLRWARGDSLSKLGKTIGATREWARNLINEWMVEASAILASREEEGLDK